MAERSKGFLPQLIGNAQIETTTDDVGMSEYTHTHTKRERERERERERRERERERERESHLFDILKLKSL